MEEQTQQNAPDSVASPADTIALETESSQRLIAIEAMIEADLKPRTFVEELLVADFAANSWRKWRIRQMEKALMDYEISHHECAPGVPRIATKAALALRSADSGSGIFTLLGRFESRYARQMAGALRLLLQLRAARSSTQNQKEPL
jgi:hypothetical protein